MRDYYFTVGEVFSPDYSVFQSIYSQFLSEEETPIFTQETAERLDDYYINDWSYEKVISNALDRALVDDEITTETIDKYAAKIWMRYGENWKHFVSYLKAEYNPIDNYNMHEVETPNLTTTTNSKTNTDLTVENDSDENTNITTEDQTYGYNSSTPVDTNKSTTTGNKNDNKTHSKSTTSGSWDDNKTNEVRTEQGTRSLERSGNIGVTTTAQMLQGDSDFWQNWDIVSAFFKDVDQVLTLGVYLNQCH